MISYFGKKYAFPQVTMKALTIALFLTAYPGSLAPAPVIVTEGVLNYTFVYKEKEALNKYEFIETNGTLAPDTHKLYSSEMFVLVSVHHSTYGIRMRF